MEKIVVRAVRREVLQGSSTIFSALTKRWQHRTGLPV